MRLLLTLLLVVPFIAPADEPIPIELTEEPLPPRAQIDDDTIVVFTAYYDDMTVEEGLLVVTGRATANTDNPNVAQARAMAQKTAKFAARVALIEFFTDLGFDKKDAETNAGYATEYADPVYFPDGTVEIYLMISLEGDIGLVNAMGLETVVEH